MPLRSIRGTSGSDERAVGHNAFETVMVPGGIRNGPPCGWNFLPLQAPSMRHTPAPAAMPRNDRVYISEPRFTDADAPYSTDRVVGRQRHIAWPVACHRTFAG